MLWCVPGRKRAVAATTQADADLVTILVEAGAMTFRQVREAVNYSPDVIEMCDIMESHGVADRGIHLTPDGFGVAFDAV